MGRDRLVLGGRFKLLRHLGGGGMSEVFLAEQLSLSRQVALKVLKRDLGKQPAMKERFRREAHLLSTVDHPSVVRVIDFETNAQDGTVLVLEFAVGETLEDALRPGPFEPVRAMRILLQLAEGLAAIHDKGIIHRDIKAQNVVLTQTARGEQARLLDFGIARLMELREDDTASTRDESLDPLVSQPGQAVGTPAYVAPEQAMAQAVTAATDVYSFGVLAFRLLSGRLPFEGPDTRAFLEQHVSQTAPSLDAVKPELAAWPGLVKLVRACLEKKPEARPLDGHALAAALRKCLPPAQIPLTTQTRQMLSAMTTQTLTVVQGGVEKVGHHGREGARLMWRLARMLDAQTRRALLVTSVIVALVPAAWATWPKSVEQRAEILLDEGKPLDALQLLERQLPVARKGELPRLLPLKVAALHRLHRTADEHALIRAQPYQALFVGSRPVLEALAEDLADAESDGELDEWVRLIPSKVVNDTFGAFAREANSKRQWGALRWLDAARRTESLDVVARYEASLSATDCTVRAKAAIRLGELQERRAIDALRELSESAKDESPLGLVNCGQDEAAEAIRRLKKR